MYIYIYILGHISSSNFSELGQGDNGHRKGLLWKAETTPPAPSISPLLHCRATPILPDVSGKPRETDGKYAEALKLQHTEWTRPNMA